MKFNRSYMLLKFNRNFLKHCIHVRLIVHVDDDNEKL